MIMGVYENINKQYFYLKKQIENIRKLRNRTYKKMLFLQMLDAFGHVRYIGGTNKERVIRLLDAYSAWEDKDRVSIVQLKSNLDQILKKQEKDDSKVYKFVREQLAFLKTGKVYGANIDPSISQIMELAKEKEKESIKSARYLELFYRYRNKVVRQFNEPGYGKRSKQYQDNAYYYADDNSWQLVFPVELLAALCTACLEGIRKHLLEENIDPCDKFSNDDMWSVQRTGKKSAVAAQ